MSEQPCLYYDAHAHLVADDQARYPRNPPPKSETPTTIPPGVAGTVSSTDRRNAYLGSRSWSEAGEEKISPPVGSAER